MQENNPAGTNASRPRRRRRGRIVGAVLLLLIGLSGFGAWMMVGRAVDAPAWVRDLI
jgi:hypothetical protein